jgi:uncharacterized membrane protein YfcA
MMDQFLLFLISFIANAFSAFAGGGAGLLQLPALIFLGLPFSAALATHKIATVALGVGATLRHLRERSLQRYYIYSVLLAGVPGVILGAHIVLFIPDRQAEIALGIMTMSLGLYSLFKPNLGQDYLPKHHSKYGALLGGSVLFIIGILNGSLTSGTGLFVTLWLVHWYGLDYKRAVAHTLVLVGLFWNGSGALTLGVYGTIQWTWLPVLLLGSFLGGYVGAHWSIIKGNRWIKHVYEFITIAVGIMLIAGRDRLLQAI